MNNTGSDVAGLTPAGAATRGQSESVVRSAGVVSLAVLMSRVTGKSSWVRTELMNQFAGEHQLEAGQVALCREEGVGERERFRKLAGLPRMKNTATPSSRARRASAKVGGIAFD